ncbi:DUF1801 domain-containing protein [Brevundimonas sp. LF-1]|uniref:DUF1801 domain-containing protein n=1 Tax=Brevundimonas sp. LF-1 TaxID=3126100 RepID=UPI0030E23E19
MSEPKTKPTDASVEDFLASVEPARRREEARTVCALMQAVTGDAPVMWGPSIVGFGRYTYVNSTNKPADWPRIGFSPRKAALTLYIMPGFQTQAALLGRLGPHTTSVSCLYIKRLDQVDMAALRTLCEWSFEEMKRRYP